MVSKGNNESVFVEIDIPLHDHCLRCDSWEHGVGYLIYAAQYPTRFDVISLSNAMEIVFPKHRYPEQWTLFEQFIETRATLSSSMNQSTADLLFYDFAKKIKAWLESGVDEPDGESTVTRRPVDDFRISYQRNEHRKKYSNNLSVLPVVGHSGKDIDLLAQMRRRQQETKDVQVAREKMARRAQKYKSV